MAHPFPARRLGLAAVIFNVEGKVWADSHQVVDSFTNRTPVFVIDIVAALEPSR